MSYTMTSMLVSVSVFDEISKELHPGRFPLFKRPTKTNANKKERVTVQLRVVCSCSGWLLPLFALRCCGGLSLSLRLRLSSLSSPPPLLHRTSHHTPGRIFLHSRLPSEEMAVISEYEEEAPAPEIIRAAAVAATITTAPDLVHEVKIEEAEEANDVETHVKQFHVDQSVADEGKQADVFGNEQEVEEGEGDEDEEEEEEEDDNDDDEAGLEQEIECSEEYNAADHLYNSARPSDTSSSARPHEEMLSYLLRQHKQQPLELLATVMEFLFRVTDLCAQEGMECRVSEMISAAAAKRRRCSGEDEGEEEEDADDDEEQFCRVPGKIAKFEQAAAASTSVKLVEQQYSDPVKAATPHNNQNLPTLVEAPSSSTPPSDAQNNTRSISSPSSLISTNVSHKDMETGSSRSREETLPPPPPFPAPAPAPVKKKTTTKQETCKEFTSDKTSPTKSAKITTTTTKAPAENNNNTCKSKATNSAENVEKKTHNNKNNKIVAKEKRQNEEEEEEESQQDGDAKGLCKLSLFC